MNFTNKKVTLTRAKHVFKLIIKSIKMRKFNLKFYDYFNIYGYDYWHNLKKKKMERSKYTKNLFLQPQQGRRVSQNIFIFVLKFEHIRHKLHERDIQHCWTFDKQSFSVKWTRTLRLCSNICYSHIYVVSARDAKKVFPVWIKS